MNKTFQIAYYIAVLLFLNQTLFAQPGEEVLKSFSKAEKHLQLDNFEEALEIYLVVLDEVPENAMANYRVGECYMNLLGKERKALPYLEKAVLQIDENFKSGSLKETGAAPKAWFYLGDAYHRDENPEKASEAYSMYMGYISEDKKEQAMVRERIIGLGVAIDEERNPSSDVLLTNLGSKINSKFSEYSIVFSGDEKTRVFSRYEKKKDIIFVSYKNEFGGWSDPVDISDQIGSQGDMYATALNYEGTELYLILLTPYDADIYYSTLNDGEWTYAENVGRSVNSKYIESNASISADGNTLYFSSDRANSIGGFDIYTSTRTDGKWSKAENLGEVINSKENEESPFISNDSQTLYFSSDRPGSIGRMDIYLSKRLDDGWGVPENMGLPYNSVEDDVSFVFYDKYNKGYIGRDLPGGFGKLDLYMTQSGIDRQREISDFMASRKPKEEPKEQVSEPVVAAAIASEVMVPDPLPEQVPEPAPEPEPILETPKEEVVVAAIIPDKEEEKEEVIIGVVEKKAEETRIVREPPVSKPVVPQTSVTTFEELDYTIQFLALIFPKRQSSYRGLDPSKIRRIEGGDGFTRYIYGTYNSREEALNDLRVIFKHGYDDAFIRKTSEINNFGE